MGNESTAAAATTKSFSKDFKRYYIRLTIGQRRRIAAIITPAHIAANSLYPYLHGPSDADSSITKFLNR